MGPAWQEIRISFHEIKRGRSGGGGFATELRARYARREWDWSRVGSAGLISNSAVAVQVLLRGAMRIASLQKFAMSRIHVTLHLGTIHK